VRAELTKRLDVKRSDVRARGDMIGIPLPNILDRWALHTGRCGGATEKGRAVPERPSVDASFVWRRKTTYAIGAPLRASGCDGERVMTERPLPLTMLFSRPARRRDFIMLLSGVAAWPLAARAQQAAMPVVGLINAGVPEPAAYRVTAFRQGLSESGYVEGQSVAIEYRWAEGRYELIPELVADLLRRRVAIIATPGSTDAALAAKTATSAVPIVFADGEDPVKLGLVASLARPGGNVTGIAVPATELDGKRMRLLRELVPMATAVGVLLNPSRPTFDAQLKEIQEAARAVRQEVRILQASSEHEIGFAFVIAAQWRPGAVLVAPDAFFDGRREQLVALAKSHAIPTIYDSRAFVAAGGLMSYGSFADGYRETGIYAGRILKGENPADLPVTQPTKFELVINRKAAKALGLDVPDKLLALADEVIE
jgi:putative tryptophan/tyrosine transport system substrate-binding protein